MNALTRVLKARLGDRFVDVPIQFEWPAQDNAVWSCKWEIAWPDRKRTNAARGVDAIQAMLLAMQMVGAELYCSDLHKAGRLSWVETWIGYGFPVPINLRDALIGDDKTL